MDQLLSHIRNVFIMHHLTVKCFWYRICYDIYIPLFDALHAAENILIKHKSDPNISEGF